jgi:8-oxo-dGTP diphosphatase
VTAEVERFATPRLAAGVLFRHADGRILLVKPTYKDGWEIPGGYVETGESPRAAAVREVREELGLDVDLADMLVLDWAPHPAEGDKLLLIFDGGQLDDATVSRLALAQHEIANAAFFPVDRLFDVMPARLARRVAYAASGHANAYLEHGIEPDPQVIASAN